jgi:galactokinase/mevalonate kinase-like predicted kinase
MYTTDTKVNHTKITHPDYTSEIAIIFTNLKRVKGKLQDAKHKEIAENIAKAMNLYDKLKNTSDKISQKALVQIIKDAL